MNKPLAIVAVVLLSAGAFTLLHAEQPAGEAKISVEVPAAVEATVKAESFGAKIIDLRREKQDNNTVYIATLKNGTHEYTLSVTESGVFQRKQLEGQEDPNKSIPFEQAPESVRKTIARESDDARVDNVTREETRTTYSAEWTLAKNHYNIRIGADGTLISKDRNDAEENK